MTTSRLLCALAFALILMVALAAPAQAVLCYVDADGDGYGDAGDAGTDDPDGTCDAGFSDNNLDCNDSDASVYPGAVELCDGIDNDCNGQVDDGAGTTWYADNDGDGWGDDAQTQISCTQPAGYVANGGDCDDTDASINPGAAELCNGIDDDCNGTVDDNPTDGTVWYADNDSDGFGTATSTVVACAQPPGYVTNDADCDDTDAGVNPAAAEVCDGKDNDCNGTIDDNPTDGTAWYADSDSDGYGDGGNSVLACSPPAGYVADGSDCDDGDASVNPGAAEVCGDGKDNNCDGQIDEATTWYEDFDSDGYGDPSVQVQQCAQPNGFVSNNTDCDDADANVNPGAAEICDGIDNNCNSVVDEGVLTTWYEDFDSDGYGDPSVEVLACAPPPGFVADNTDCDDTDGSVNPGAAEICDGIDNNCNSVIDEGVLTTWYEDFDSDGYGDPAVDVQACSPPPGFVADNTDCDDTDAGLNPGATEACDGIDNNCNGEVDEGCDACPVVVTGDVNQTGTRTSADIIAMVNFVFKGGQPPDPCQAAADVNCDGAVTAADIIFLVNHVFKGGPVPCDVCTLIPATWSCP